MSARNAKTNNISPTKSSGEIYLMKGFPLNDISVSTTSACLNGSPEIPVCFTCRGRSLNGNMLKSPLGQKGAEVRKTPAGLETWKTTPAGILLIRQNNLRWFIEQFKGMGFTVKKRAAGQFTELYTKISSPPLQKLIHGFNNLWFSYVKLPHPAFANIVILQKQS